MVVRSGALAISIEEWYVMVALSFNDLCGGII